ncbi:ribosomal maturation YjgA family protein [Galbibacter mesophilus]|uniref:ribosomal maturation YjgA family protein n=1 Tax=Galbibacter mesophilus TaxID=379069 RepID=UPI00191D7578
MHFKPKHFILFIFFLCIEVGIALFSKNQFIRGFLGDFLVIPLLYFFVKSFIRIKGSNLSFYILIIAIFTEVLQLLEIQKHFQIENPYVKIIMGTTFDFKDLIAYFLGFLLILFFDKSSPTMLKKRSRIY